MQNSFRSAPAPCIVNEGILINKTDMMRVLETIESVRYEYLIDGASISTGEGIVVKVFSSPDTSTLVINGCLFLNVLSFNYLRFYPAENNVTTIELTDECRILKLTSIEEDGRRLARVNREIFASCAFSEHAPAELFDDSDDDDRF